MFFNFFKKNKGLNVSSQKYLVDFMSNFKTFEIIMVIFLIIPIILNFLFYAIYHQNHKLQDIFLLLPKLFDKAFYQKYCFKILLGVLQAIFLSSFGISAIVRVLISLSFLRNLKTFKITNITFYDRFKWYARLSVICPFVSWKIYEDLIHETDYVSNSSIKK